MFLDSSVKRSKKLVPSSLSHVLQMNLDTDELTNEIHPLESNTIIKSGTDCSRASVCRNLLFSAWSSSKKSSFSFGKDVRCYCKRHMWDSYWMIEWVRYTIYLTYRWAAFVASFLVFFHKEISDGDVVKFRRGKESWCCSSTCCVVCMIFWWYLNWISCVIKLLLNANCRRSFASCK